MLLFLMQNQSLLRITTMKLAIEQGSEVCLGRNWIFFPYVENIQEILRMCCPHGDISYFPGATENVFCEKCKSTDLYWEPWECSFVIKVFTLQAQGPDFNL